MEINAHKMEALLHLQEQQAQLPRRNIGQAAGFEEMLDASMAGAQQAHPAGTSASEGAAALYSQILLNPAQAASEVDADDLVMQAAFEQASGTLQLWDDYAATLGSATPASLKEAYAMLENIDSRVAEMRSNSVFGSNAALGGLLNELEVMSTVEKYKFNRGDYLL